jgi:sugar lactone lactonase YvrE
LTFRIFNVILFNINMLDTIWRHLFFFGRGIIMAIKSGGGLLNRRLGTFLLLLIVPVICCTGCATVEKRLDIRFYPPPPTPPKIQFLKAIYSSNDVAKSSKFQSFVTGALDEKGFSKPYGVAVHEGIIYICDSRAGMVTKIDLANEGFDRIHDQGAGKLRRPINLDIDRDGTVYVADIALQQIMVYSKSGKFTKAFGAKDQFKPVDVAIFGDKLYVLDIGDNEVEVLDKKSGELLGAFGEPGGEEGQLAKPTNLAVDREGNLYITNTLNCRIDKFDADGEFVLSFGQCGDNLGSFVRPKGIAVDDNGFIYVVDAAFENVQIFSPETELALFFGGSGGPDVPGSLWLPAGIALDKSLVPFFESIHHPDFMVEYLILVSSQFGPPHITIYGFGEAREGTPLEKGEVRTFEEEGELKSGNIPQDVGEAPQR